MFQHIQRVHRLRTGHRCPLCEERFDNLRRLTEHVRQHPLGECQVPPDNTTIFLNFFHRDTWKFSSFVDPFRVPLFIEDAVRHRVIQHLYFKGVLIADVQLVKPDEEDTVSIPMRSAYFRLSFREMEDVKEILDNAWQDILCKLDSLENLEGSGWNVLGMTKLNLEWYIEED